MDVIWKFPLAEADRQTVMIPRQAELLCVQVQRDTPCLWARCDSARDSVVIEIAIIGTGSPIRTDDRLTYVDTFQMRDGHLVWHVFVVGAGTSP